MPLTIFQDPWRYRVRSLLTLWRICAQVIMRRAIGKPLVREWSAAFEIGTLFWRAQFNHAFALGNMVQGRAYFDSLVMVMDRHLDVAIAPSQPNEPSGHWFTPSHRTSEATMLYLHGGGYSFYASVTRHFIALLAHLLGMRIFAPDYRLTPEHAHPAQMEDGLAAYRFLLDKGVDPTQLVVCGDSAGGHLVLMLLAQLRAKQWPQPAIGIALNPWTDTGLRGASQFGHDCYDLVQGYMTVRFAEWLKGNTGVADAEISPMHQDFSNVAPLYLQAGGKEILVDMIRDFARAARDQGATVRLDVWEHMTHEFHAYGQHLPESREALQRLEQAIACATGKKPFGRFAASALTEIDHWPSSPL